MRPSREHEQGFVPASCEQEGSYFRLMYTLLQRLVKGIGYGTVSSRALRKYCTRSFADESWIRTGNDKARGISNGYREPLQLGSGIADAQPQAASLAGDCTAWNLDCDL